MRDVEAGRESALMIGRGCELSGDGRGGRCDVADDLAVPRGGKNELNLQIHLLRALIIVFDPVNGRTYI